MNMLVNFFDLIMDSENSDSRSLEETARFIFSTATSTSSSVTVNYLIPILLFAIPVLYFVFRLGLFNLDDALGMTSGLDLSGYNAPAAGYGAPVQTYNAPAPSYNAPAPSYNAPAPSYNAPAPSYNAPAPARPSYNNNGVGLTSSTSSVNSGALSFLSKDDNEINLEYISQINDELDQLRRLRDLLQHGGGRISLVDSDEIIVHPSPRIDVMNTWNGLPGL